MRLASTWSTTPGRRAVIQGFGKVGGPLAFLLQSAGMRIGAVGDVTEAGLPGNANPLRAAQAPAGVRFTLGGHVVGAHAH